MSYVFISYNQKDSDFAENLKTRIEEQKLSMWTYESRLIPGEDWRYSIDEAIKNSFALIVIMTPSAQSSEYVTYEWAFAWGLNVKIIPVLLEPTRLHPRLETLQYFDFTNHKGGPWEKLITFLKKIAES